MNNDTDSNSSSSVDVNIKYKLYIIVPIVWSTIIFFGLLGNGTIIYIILKKRLYKDSCTNCYIINVSIADLCFTMICVPVTMTAYIYKEWMFGAFMCSFENLLMFSSVQAACLTLTAMTVDRYLAVLYPFKSIEYRTTKLALVTNIIIWIVSFTLSFPYFLYYKQVTTEEDHLYCVADFPEFDLNVRGRMVHVNMEIVLSLYTVMISYVLPLMTIIFCYARMILRIYGKSSAEQRLIEGAKSFSNNHAVIAHSTSGMDDGLRVNVPNRQTRISLDNYGSGCGAAIARPYSVGYMKNKRGSVPIDRLMLPLSSSDSNQFGMSKRGGDLNKSMEDFLEEMEDMTSSRRASAIEAMKLSSDANRKQEVHWSASRNNNNNEGDEENMLLKPNAGSNNQDLNNEYMSRVQYRNLPTNHHNHNVATATSSPKRTTTSYSVTTSTSIPTLNHNRTLSASSSSAGGRFSTMSNMETIRKQKQRILMLIATVSLTFAITWLPAHFIQLWRVIFKSTFPYNDAMYIIKLVGHTLSYSNSFLNPLIYVFMGSRFRNHIRSEFSYLFDLFRRKRDRGATVNMINTKYLMTRQQSLHTRVSMCGGGSSETATLNNNNNNNKSPYSPPDSFNLIGMNSHFRTTPNNKR